MAGVQGMQGVQVARGAQGAVLPGPGGAPGAPGVQGWRIVGRAFRTKHTILPVVERGCCCSLETCCRVQGYLCAILTSCYIMGRLLELVVDHDALGENLVRCADLADHQRGGRFLVDSYDDSRRPCRTRISWGDSTATDVLIAITMLLDAVTFVVAIMFLKGISKRSAALMRHYVRLLKVHVAFNIFLAAMVSFMMGRIFPFFLLIFLSAGIPFYCAVCANSLYMRVCAEEAAVGAELLPAYVPPGSGWAPPTMGPPPMGPPPMGPPPMGPPPMGPPPMGLGPVTYMPAPAASDGPPPYSPPAPGFVVPQPGGYPSYPPYPTKEGPPPAMV